MFVQDMGMTSGNVMYCKPQNPTNPTTAKAPARNQAHPRGEATLDDDDDDSEESEAFELPPAEAQTPELVES